MSQPQLVKAPTWLRILQVSIGAISIILSGYVLAQPGLGIITAVRILSIVLLFVGIESTAVGTFSRYLRTSSRFSSIALGASAIEYDSRTLEGDRSIYLPQPNPMFEPTHYDERVAHALGLDYQELQNKFKQGELEHRRAGCDSTGRDNCWRDEDPNAVF